MLGGGSPPNPALNGFDMARMNQIWQKMYQGHIPLGAMGNSMSAGMPMSSNEEEMRGPSHIPLLPPHPPQREALNLDVKDEVRILAKH